MKFYLLYIDNNIIVILLLYTYFNAYFNAYYNTVVSNNLLVTKYGSQFELGLLSSK